MEKIYVKGLTVFKPHEKAPDFVKGTMMITPNDLIQFCKEHEDKMTEYKDKKQLRCQILEGEHGLYFVLDTWKPEQKQTEQQEDDDLPF